MDDSERVRLGDRLRAFDDDPHRLLDGQGALLGEERIYAHPVQPLHDHVGDPLLRGPDVVDAHRVAPGDARGRTRLAKEARERVGLPCQRRTQHLDGHGLPKVEVLAAEHHAHAALP
ncbi:hypothetical protein BH11MYX4_BH11MYX4_33760 [soil metagenome]